MKMKFYEYKACSTCQKAAKFLEEKGVPFERIPIVDTPPNCLVLWFITVISILIVRL